MATDPTFFILPAHLFIKASETPTLLNSITKNFRSPLDNFVPTTKSQQPPNTYYDPAELQTNTFHDFQYSIGTSSNTSIYAKLQGLAGVKFRVAKDSGFNLNGRTIEYQRLSQHDVIFPQLKENDAVRAVVPQWVKNTSSLKIIGHTLPPVCWITGVFISFEAKHTQSSSSQRAAQVNVTLPVTEAAGAPSGVTDPEIGIDAEGRRGKEFTAHGKDGNIFALELKVLKLKGGKLLSGSKEQELVNTELAPKTEGGRQLGQDEEHDEDHESDESDESGPDATGAVKKTMPKKAEEEAQFTDLEFEDPTLSDVAEYTAM